MSYRGTYGSYSNELGSRRFIYIDSDPVGDLQLHNFALINKVGHQCAQQAAYLTAVFKWQARKLWRNVMLQLTDIINCTHKKLRVESRNEQDRSVLRL